MAQYVLGNQPQWGDGEEGRLGWTPSCVLTESAPSRPPHAVLLWQYCEKHHRSHVGPSHQGLHWRPWQKPDSHGRAVDPGMVLSSVQLLSCVQLFAHGLQHARLPCPSPPPRAFLNSCPLSWWCHPAISSSVIPFSSCLQSFLASGSFLRSQLFTPGGQSIGASASASVLPMNIQDWFPLGLTGLISLSKWLSRVCSNNALGAGCMCQFPWL